MAADLNYMSKRRHERSDLSLASRDAVDENGAKIGAEENSDLSLTIAADELLLMRTTV